MFLVSYIRVAGICCDLYETQSGWRLQSYGQLANRSGSKKLILEDYKRVDLRDFEQKILNWINSYDDDNLL